jgi:class 3 adenylate cyclase/tetratricopeptide (TPR) repeat protein
MVCQRCGFQNPAAFSYCGRCGERLAAREPAGREDERKLVTAFFCDVAGFTQRASVLDPEDVHRLLSPYYAKAREELERLGGTVEKFIGDAVFALFGAPRAHGDDAERAVRAALAIRDAVVDLNEETPGLDLHIRLGLATGEAMVEPGARPIEGEGMAWGDVTNTAFRIQAAAPSDSILVDDATYRATNRVIEYAEAEPIHAKGKDEPVVVWRAIAARARRGLDLTQAEDEPLIGRSDEVSLLLQTLDRAEERGAAQLLTLVGEPGIGKSRLVFELFRRIEHSPDRLVNWRQGRSSLFGGGSTFSELGEVVKAQAGILESDGAAVAAEKLERTVDDLVADRTERTRIITHLRPLVGLDQSADGHGDQRDASFAAWRSFVEALAAQRPLVLVFEDLHWADDGLLDFIEHILEWVRNEPVLILATARPELLTRRPDWGAPSGAETILLRPLSEQETAELVDALAGDAIQETSVAAIVGAASGNPLYAVEFARMLQDRARSGVPEAERRLLVPESVHAIIAARLDSLPAEDKGLLQDASVVGRVVWPGALAAIGRRSARAVAEHLRELERMEFLTRERPSSVARESEYRFRHVLVRDVAYGQIPRARRSDAHRRTAEWFESLSPDRAADRAEMLAHHYLSAFELARATGTETEDLTTSARVSLRNAGDRALSLHSCAAAARYFSAALELWPESDSEKPLVLFRLGKSLFYAEAEGADVLEEARQSLLALGDRETAAEAETFLTGIAHAHGESQERVFEHATRARMFVEGLEPSRATVEVLADLSQLLNMAAEHEEAIRLASEALRDAEALGLRELQARALYTIGMSRGLSGDPGGREDLERSIEILEEIDSYLSAQACGMLAEFENTLGNLSSGFALQARAREHAERFGHTAYVRWLSAEHVAEHYWSGRWEEGLAGADTFLREAESSPHFMESYCRHMRGRMRLGRGDVECAIEDSVIALQQARASNEPQMLFPALAFRARALAATAEVDAAGKTVDELLELWSQRLNAIPASAWIVDVAVALELIGRTHELADAARGVAATTAWLEAAVAFSTSDFGRAADLFARIESKPDEALARVHAARRLRERGRKRESRTELKNALDFYRQAGAAAYMPEAEDLLAAGRTTL